MRYVIVYILFIFFHPLMYSQVLTIANNGTYTSTQTKTYTGLTLGNSSTLNVVEDHVLTINGDATSNNGLGIIIEESATLIITGTLIGNNNIELNVSGILIVGGISIENNGELTITGTGTLIVEGDFTAGSNATINVDGDMIVDGNITIGGGTSTVTSNGSISHSGTYSGPAIGGSGEVNDCTNTYVWTGSTSTQWSTPENWLCNEVPDASKNVIIPSTGVTNWPTINNASGESSCKNLTVKTGAILNYTSTVSGNALFVHGDLEVDGTINHTGNYYIHLEGGASSNYATVKGSGSLLTAAFIVGNNNTSYYQLGSSLVVEAFWLTNAAGPSVFNMNDHNLSTWFFRVDSGTSFYHKSGTLSIEGFEAIINNTSFIEETGTTYFSRGEIWSVGDQIIPAIDFYNLKIRTNNGHIALLGGPIGTRGSFTVKNDLIVLNPAASGGEAWLYSDVNVDGSIYLGVEGNGLTFYTDWGWVRRSLSAGNTAFFMGDNDEHLIQIDWAYASGNNSPFRLGASGTEIPLTFYGTVEYMRSGSGSSIQNITKGNYQNLILSGSQSGGFGFIGEVSISKDFLISKSAGQISFNHHTLKIGKNMYNNSSGSNLNIGSSKFIFNGNSIQKIGGNTSTTFYNLELDNSGTLAHHLELEQDINVTNNLTLTKGILKLNQQSIDLGTTGTIVGENNSNYIFCECPSAYIRAVRPINTAGTAVDPGNIGLSITPSAGKPLGDVEIIRRHERVLGADGLPESISRVYEVKNASGGSVDNNGTLNATIAVKYLSHELNGFDPASISIYRQPDLTVDTWFEYGGSINTSTQHAIFEGWNAFSGITLGEFNQPLPITYLGMEGECSSKGYVELRWETASENNSSHFVIERSRDGFEWHTTATVPAAGSSNQTIQYTHHDLTSGRYFEGYYRLRQVDIDGKETELPAIAVFCDTKGETTLELYPNPTSGPVNVYIYSEHGENVITTLVMTDALGRKIQEIPLMLKSGGNLIEMNVSELQQGVYNITLYQPDNSALTKRLVKN